MAGRKKPTENMNMPPIDKSSPIPYYVQLKEAIRDKIERGEWTPGRLISGEPELCRYFDISRTVVRQALKELTYEGLIYRKKGKGTFVAEPKISEKLVQELTGFYKEMEELGHQPVSQVLKQHVVPAGKKIAKLLSLSLNALVIEIQRLRYIAGEPIVLVTSYLPYNACSKLLRADLTHSSLYKFIEEQCGLVIDRGHRSIEAVPANEYEAQLLQVEKGTPLILLESVSYLSDGSPIEYYHALHRGDRSRFEVELVRVREYGKPRELLGSESQSLDVLR